MNFEATSLPGVYLLKPRVFGDARGFFLESWNADTFSNAGFELSFVQDNHSRSQGGTLRGLHYQMQHTQGKLVRVTTGSVFDVAVDMRRDSPTLGQWFGCVLDDIEHHMLWVPPGFAHGFYVMSESADFQYKCTDRYHPESEITLAWDDPTVGIDWPLMNDRAPTLSDKDRRGLALTEAPLFG